MPLSKCCHCEVCGVLQGFQTEQNKEEGGKEHDKLCTYETSAFGQDGMKMCEIAIGANLRNVKIV